MEEGYTVKKAKYLSIMATIVLIMVLLGVSFAWYSAGNASVSAHDLQVTASAPNVSPLNFKYDPDKDVILSQLYISDINLVADQYGRSIYTGEEGFDADETDAEGQLVDPDHRFTLYYIIELENTSGEEVSANLALIGNTIYKMRLNEDGDKWNTINIGDNAYTISGTNVMNGSTDVGDLAEGTGAYKDGIVTIGADTYYLVSGIVYQLTDGTDFDLSKLTEVGYYGTKTIGSVGNYQLFVCEWDENIGTSTIEAFTRDDYTIENRTITIAGATDGVATTQKFLIGIRYQSMSTHDASNLWAYSDRSYMGSYFNFDIELTSNTPA